MITVEELFAAHPPQTYLYDSERRAFLIGSDRVPLREFKDYVPPHDLAIADEAAEWLIDESALVYGFFGQVMQMPKLHNWLAARSFRQWQSVRTEVSEVMRDAYREGSEERVRTLPAIGEFGFDITFVRIGQVRLQLPEIGGAHMEPRPNSFIFPEKLWKYGFAEYDIYGFDENVPVQELALHAGIAALAAACQRDA